MVDLVFLNDGNLPVESIRSDEGSQQLLGAAAKHHRTTRTNLGGTDFRSKLLGVERKSLELTGGCSYCLRMNQVKSKVENTFVHLSIVTILHWIECSLPDPLQLFEGVACLQLYRIIGG